MAGPRALTQGATGINRCVSSYRAASLACHAYLHHAELGAGVGEVDAVIDALRHGEEFDECLEVPAHQNIDAGLVSPGVLCVARFQILRPTERLT